LTEIHFATLDTCSTAYGVVVAIDVVRAFTTAAFAFAAGAKRILLAGTVEEALALRQRFPGALVMGEVGGKRVADFDLWNSPAQLLAHDLSGLTLVQRTSAGTQGIVRAASAEHLFAASFVIAGATLRAIRALNPTELTFVVTGEHPEDEKYGREDRACAHYLADLLCGRQPDRPAALTWASTFLAERLEGETESLRQDFSADLQLCTQIDRFDFAMPVTRQGDLLVMEKTS
jgi:2-phosphosulfolactate phosphatase